MDHGQIAVIVYVSVLCVFLIVSGFVSRKSSIDGRGLVLASILWPLSIMVFPTLYAGKFLYNAGIWIARKLTPEPHE